MRLYEYESKKVLAKYGVPVPRGEVVTNSREAQEAATSIQPPLAVKAQILVSGRGKAGGVLFADSVKEATNQAEKLFNNRIKISLSRRF